MLTELPPSYRLIKSRDFQDFDFLILDNKGLPYAYLEIKVRRQSLDLFGDAIFPYRKHQFARKLLLKHKIGFVAAVEYPDALVQVDLAATPSEVKMIHRTGRAKAVKHALYSGDQLTVLVRS